MSWATKAFMLGQYGVELEQRDGPAAMATFMAVQVVLLTVLATMLGLPFTGQALTSSVIYAASRRDPMAGIAYKFVPSIPYWTLPFALVVVEVLEANANPMAAIPSLLGIFTGHFHHFVRYVWPNLSGGKPWFTSPSVLKAWEGAGEVDEEDLAPRRGRRIGGEE
jgi:Derlin-2/3